MKTAELVMLSSYNAWANQRLLRRLNALTRRELTRPSWLSHKHLLGTLIHILDTQWYWRTGCQTGLLPVETLTPEDFPSLASLRRRWKEEDQALVAFVRSLSDSQVLRRVALRRPRARPRRRTLWHLIVHIVNHGTHHRSEVGAYLATLDRSPGDLDFIRFVTRRS